MKIHSDYYIAGTILGFIIITVSTTQSMMLYWGFVCYTWGNRITDLVTFAIGFLLIYHCSNQAIKSLIKETVKETH